MAALLGLGEQNVCLIQTDKAGHMDPIHLELQVQRITATGAAPFMVVATAGTVYCLQIVALGIFSRGTEISINPGSYRLFCGGQRPVEVIMHHNIIT
jgi:hypothetical protein